MRSREIFKNCYTEKNDSSLNPYLALQKPETKYIPNHLQGITKNIMYK